MNQELTSLYETDKQERTNQPLVNTPEYKAMRVRDRARRERVMEIVQANELSSAEDYYHAAQIMNHEDTIDDARTAHMLALQSSELGYRPARWLAAASYDRWQRYPRGNHKNMERITCMTDDRIGSGTLTPGRQMRKEPGGTFPHGHSNLAR